MFALNQVMLIGTLGKDPEPLKSTEQGDFVRLSLATSKKFKSKTGEVREDTQWHTVYLNNRLGRLGTTYLKKGAKIFVSGELRTRDWQDTQGQKHRLTAVYANELKFLSDKSKKGEAIPLDLVEEDVGAQAIQDIRQKLSVHSSDKLA